MYDSAGTNKTTMIHLFGIIYGDKMKEGNIKPIEVLTAAQMHESYVTEVNKGIRLSQYVELKKYYFEKF